MKILKVILRAIAEILYLVLFVWELVFKLVADIIMILALRVEDKCTFKDTWVIFSEKYRNAFRNEFDYIKNGD